MKASFLVTGEFIQSYKMGHVDPVSSEVIHERFGFCDTFGNWFGIFTSKDGSEMKACFWSHADSLYNCGRVSVWIGNNLYLQEFKDFIKSA